MKRKYLLFVIILFLAVFCYFFIGRVSQEEIIWGVNFSQKHSQGLGLDWQENYLALLDDLAVKDLRLIAYWDSIEPENNQYNFQDLDWQVKEAEKRGARIILVVGMKTPRWPECHIPAWAAGLTDQERETEILEFLKETIARYENSDSIIAWQVENEVFFPFGECPEIREDFFEQEIALTRSLDPDRKIIITESGTGSFWFKGAKLGDIVGISLYRKAWFHELKIYVKYFSPPIFYWRKAQIIKKLFDKEVICTELQAEPWGPVLLYDLPTEEQEKTMNLETFRKNVEFAKGTGLSKFYFWGAEWWYWMKTEQRPEIWEEAREIIN